MNKIKYKLMSVIYKVALKDGSDLLVSSEYKVYAYETNLFSISLGEKTLSEDFNNPLSPESIGYLVASDNATYEESLSCGAISLALGKKDINSSKDTNVISLIKNSYVSSKSDSDNLVNLSIFDLFCLTSSNKNSGAINSNCLTTEFFENKECETPLLIKEEITTLASTINLSGIFYNESYLLDKEMLISSANLSAWDCVNCDLATAFLNLINLERLSRNNLLISIDTSNFGNSLNSDSSSLGISISMNLDRNSDYINLSEFSLKKVTDIKLVKINHVYNLAIENTYNFVANDIIAHSLYIGDNFTLYLWGETVNVMTGNLNLSANINLTMNGGRQIGSNVTCVTIKGPSSILEIC